MKPFNLQGCFTALVTPFTKSGQVDDDALHALVEWQIKEGINGLVVCGTTGESVTLSEEEHHHVVEVVIARSAGRVPVLAGAGGNNTQKVIALAKHAKSSGANGILSVTPYYNKPTQGGLLAHYRAIAEAVTLPLILYNVPGRTGVNMLPETTLKLAEIPNVVAIKEASGNLVQVMEILCGKAKNFFVLSGDDALTLPMIAAGASGVISVVSNQIPKEFVRLVRAALEGDFQLARMLQRRYWKLMQLNFIEPNPMPVKTALAMMGRVQEAFRLPLVPMPASSKSKLAEELRSLELL